MFSDSLLLKQVADIAREVGDLVMKCRDQDGSLKVKQKEDGSPVTEADKLADDFIRNRLACLETVYPYLSEEMDIPSFETRSQWQVYWLVDPLDGTRGYIEGNNEFTVNIALVENGQATLGVVHVPAEEKSYVAARGYGAFLVANRQWRPIKTHSLGRDKQLNVLSSRRQVDLEPFKRCLGAVKTSGFKVNLSYTSSSLKFCRLAEGKADLIPCFVDTCEWDTAAAQIIIEEAGGLFVRADNLQGFIYNQQESLTNPFFLALGDNRVDWEILFLKPKMP